MNAQAEMIAEIKSIPWSKHVLKIGRLGSVEAAANLPAQRPARFWFTPENMNEEEESIFRNYGFLITSDEFKFKD